MAAGEVTANRPPTVLVVDDEPTVLSFVRKVLERAGFQTLCAPSALRAVEICASTGQEISVIVTDVQMPEMNGRQLAECLRVSHPHIPILFMTGYIADSENRDALTGDVRLDGHRIIRKPFSGEILLGVVQSMVHHKAHAAQE